MSLVVILLIIIIIILLGGGKKLKNIFEAIILIIILILIVILVGMFFPTILAAIGGTIGILLVIGTIVLVFYGLLGLLDKIAKIFKGEKKVNNKIENESKIINEKIRTNEIEDDIPKVQKKRHIRKLTKK